MKVAVLAEGSVPNLGRDIDVAFGFEPVRA